MKASSKVKKVALGPKTGSPAKVPSPNMSPLKSKTMKMGKK